MKNRMWVALVLGLGCTSHAGIIGLDLASNYVPDWTNTLNRGVGFTPWQLWNVGTGGRFTWTSTEAGAGNIDTGGRSFGLWGNPAGNNFSYAQRMFEGGAIAVSNQFSMDIAPSTQNGHRGVSILNASAQVLWTFAAGSNAYKAGSTVLG